MSKDFDALPYRPNVGVMLINGDGMIFVAERIDTPGAWQMPQGGIDKGEDPETAAVRELEEETGVAPDAVEIVARTADWLTYDLPPELLGKIWKGKYRGQKQHWYLMRFNGDDSMITLETDHPEFSAWKWVSADELVGGIVPFKRAIYEALVEEFAPHLT